MVAIKKRTIKAYILIESLVTLSIFALISTNLLLAIDQGRRAQEEDYQQVERLIVAKMAIDTQESSLQLNGVSVQVQKTEQKIVIYSEGKELVYVEKE